MIAYGQATGFEKRLQGHKMSQFPRIHLKSWELLGDSLVRRHDSKPTRRSLHSISLNHYE